MNNKLTSSLEDYLEIICNYEKEGQVVRAVDISKVLNISRASVTEALQKLASKNLITYEKTIKLTDEGREKAIEVVSKHKVLQIFFEDILGLDSQEASENACRIEHVISEKAFDKISDFIKKG